jgi:Ring finger domain
MSTVLPLEQGQASKTEDIVQDVGFALTVTVRKMLGLDFSTAAFSSSPLHCPFVTKPQEWVPSKLPWICKSRPMGHDFLANVGDSNLENNCTPLFDDSRGFGGLVWTVADVNPVEEEDDDDDNLLYQPVDLVRAGVFKRTFKILKQQPRCVLCSVCFDIGDKVSVSSQNKCDHQYHRECILRWLVTKSDKCPVCKELYFVRPRELLVSFTDCQANCTSLRK